MIPSWISFEYAARIGRWRGIPIREIGDLYHKAAWCCDDAKEKEQENRYRGKAIGAFEYEPSKNDDMAPPEAFTLAHNSAALCGTRCSLPGISRMVSRQMKVGLFSNPPFGCRDRPGGLHITHRISGIVVCRLPSARFLPKKDGAFVSE